MTRSGQNGNGNGPDRPGGVLATFRSMLMLLLGVAIVIYQVFISHTDRLWPYGVAFVLMGFVDERLIGRIIVAVFPQGGGRE